MKIIFIRHGMTKGNKEKRYIGITDESLLKEGKNQILNISYPEVEVVYTSSMARCLETASLIYPHITPCVEPGFNECDFGKFEGHNYSELSDDPYYNAWIQSDGILPFPGGESRQCFTQRCISAFTSVLEKEKTAKTLAFVVHGGTIMAIMDQYSSPHKDYYDWFVPNGGGYITEFDPGRKKLIVKEKI